MARNKKLAQNFGGVKMKWLKELFSRKPKQTTFCYCPKCNNELIGSNSFVSDLYVNGENEVTYKCSECGHVSIWNFDITPVPVLMGK